MIPDSKMAKIRKNVKNQERNKDRIRTLDPDGPCQTVQLCCVNLFNK